MSGKIKEILEALKSHNDIIKEYPLTLSIEEQKLLLDYITNLQEEIERLKNINEEHRILNGELRKELQQKENIMKEVREYIENHFLYHYGSDKKPIVFEDNYIQEIVDILDKESKQ